MYLSTFLKNAPYSIEEVCIKHSVSKLYAFGSSVNGQFNEASSDIDLLVTIGIEDPMERGLTLLSLWDSLEGFFGRKVDLLTENSIHNPYLKQSIEKERQLIYDRQATKVIG
jgi:uncharacterized protein